MEWGACLTVFADVNKMSPLILLQGKPNELSDSGIGARENLKIECGKNFVKASNV